MVPKTIYTGISINPKPFTCYSNVKNAQTTNRSIYFGKTIRKLLKKTIITIGQQRC